jgi:hypothetical protein
LSWKAGAGGPSGGGKQGRRWLKTLEKTLPCGFGGIYLVRLVQNEHGAKAILPELWSVKKTNSYQY